jgi:hypothetical protein
LLSIAVLSILAAGIAYADALPAQMQEDLTLAIKSVNEAESAGADVSDLVNMFNAAMAMVGDKDSCVDETECLKAGAIFKEVSLKASMRKQQAENDTYMQGIISYAIYAPAGSLAAATVAVLALKFYNEYRERRFMNLEVRLRDE